MQAGPPPVAPQKRLARLAVLLSRAALGLPPAAQAASARQSLGEASPSGMQMPTAAPHGADSQLVAADSGGGRLPSGDILRGLAQLSLQGDARAEQTLADALSAESCQADEGCAICHRSWHM